MMVSMPSWRPWISARAWSSKREPANRPFVVHNIETTFMTEKIAGRGFKANWPMHAAIVAWATFAISLEHWFPDWGVPIAVGGGVIGISIYAQRRLWPRVWFWIAIAIWTVLQVPLMTRVQPLITQYKLMFTFPFAIVDFLGFAVFGQVLSIMFGVDKPNWDAFKSKK